MKLSGYESDAAILAELGSRIKARRIASNLTQAELARKCGTSLSTLVRMEQGDDVKVSNLVRVLRTLNLSQNLDMLVPEEKEDFKALFEGRQKRQRVSKKNQGATPFVWGEDRL